MRVRRIKSLPEMPGRPCNSAYISVMYKHHHLGTGTRRGIGVTNTVVECGFNEVGSRGQIAP